MMGKTCAVTGHRDIPTDCVEYVKNRLKVEIEKALADGYTQFVCGFEEGVDQYFAEIVASKCKGNTALRLEAAIPYRKRYFQLIKDEKTAALLAACTDIYIVSEDYAPNVFMKRNRYMVENADRVIAVYDGREKGGTVSTIRMVHMKRKELREIPLKLYVTRADLTC